MVAISYPLHHHTDVQVGTDPVTLFAHLDDHMRLAAHMERPSLMTAGATMHIETDERQGRAIGSIISMHGRVLGLNLRLDEMVIEYDPPRSKVWETRGQPRLLVIGGYRMGFKVAERERGSQLTVFIDYQLPERGIERLLGRIFGSTYAAWCTRSMATDAAHAFPPGSTLPNAKAGKRP